MRRRIIFPPLLLLAACALVACGQKGPLTRPTASATAKPAPAASTGSSASAAGPTSAALPASAGSSR